MAAVVYIKTKRKLPIRNHVESGNKMPIKNSVIGMNPFWWEEIDYDVLVVFENPHYFSSDSKQNTSLSGEIDTEDPKFSFFGFNPKE